MIWTTLITTDQAATHKQQHYSADNRLDEHDDPSHGTEYAL